MGTSALPRRRGRPPSVKTAATQPANNLVASSLDDFLGPAPLLDGEDKRAYIGLLEEVRQQVVRKDAIEKIYIRDVVDLTWEPMRSRRVKVAILHKGQVRAIQQLTSSKNWPELKSDAKFSVRAAVKTSFSDGIKALAGYDVTLPNVNA